MSQQDLEILIEAIQEKKNISFDYKNKGKRFGNPYAIYENEKYKQYLDLYQTSGISDRVSKGTGTFPQWATLEADFISDVVIIGDTFSHDSDGYNGYNGYKRYSKRFQAANIKI